MSSVWKVDEEEEVGEANDQCFIDQAGSLSTRHDTTRSDRPVETNARAQAQLWFSSRRLDLIRLSNTGIPRQAGRDLHKL